MVVNGSITSAISSTTGNVIVGGSLTVNGFYSIKPYIGCYVSSNGTVSTTIKPDYVTPTIAKTTGQSVFTLPTAHPSGTNYTVFVQQRMSSQTVANALYGVPISSSTSFTVWSKSTSNVAADSDFYVHTVP